nr:saccharopine dehydrogenase [Chitinophagaceae bacterium]
AHDCVEAGKHLLTASYVDENIKTLQSRIEEKKLLFLCEMGLDPGIDHMSAMRIINKIKKNGGKITSFISHCGGLVAPESDDNPWHYKISWNPRNIVLAGKEGATYLLKDKKIKLQYQQVFNKCMPVTIENLYPLAWYANRDSLSYIELYGLQDTKTFIRTTLRHPAFCRGWNKIINIGLTNTEDLEKIKDCKTYADWYQLKISPFINNNKDWNFYLQLYITDPFKDEFSKQVNYLGLRTKELLPEGFTSSESILQYAMEKKLCIHETDKDMIVMLHELEYEATDNTGIGKTQKIKSTLIVKGENSLKTAMAKTVGLPLGIAAKMILQDKLNLTGLHIPVSPQIYEPILTELEAQGIKFSETEEGVTH